MVAEQAGKELPSWPTTSVTRPWTRGRS